MNFESTIFDPDQAFSDTDGLGTTSEDLVSDPDDITIKDGPVPTTKMENTTEGLGHTTSDPILNPDEVSIRDEDKGVQKADRVHDKADDYREEQGEQSFDKISEDCPAQLEALIPGYHAFMEDDSVETKEESNPAAEAEEVAGEEEEVEAATEAMMEDVHQADLLFDIYDTYATMYSHAARYGVDRTFLSLMNHNNQLGRTLQISFPATESFATVGDPNGQVTIACLEGIGDAMRSIGGFFASLGQKTVILLQRMSEAVQTRFRSLEANIARIRQRLADLEDDEPRAAKTGAKVYSLNALASVKQAIHANYAAIIDKTVNTLPELLRRIEIQDTDTVENTISGFDQQLAQLSEQRDIFKQAKKSMDKVPLAQISRADAIRLLDLAESMKSDIDQATAIAKKVKDVAAQFKKDAKVLGDKPAGKRVAKLLNKTRKVVTKLLKGDLWLAKQCVRVAALRVRIGSSRDGGQMDDFGMDDDFGMENFKERTIDHRAVPALESISPAKKKEIAETIAKVAKQVFDNLKSPITSYVSWVYDDAKDDFFNRAWQDACSVIRVALPKPNQGHDDPRWKQIYDVYNQILSRLPNDLKSNFQPALGADSGDFYISI